MVSKRELIAHVVRRLGVGSNATVVDSVTTVDQAIDAALDLSTPLAEPPTYFPPLDREDFNDFGGAVTSLRWWIDRMGSGERLIEERMIWFWHDHFAMHVRKIGIPYLAIQHVHLLRTHAMGNFGDLLHAVAVDPAMLRYLDTANSTAENPNENFAREVMELHTLGTGNYTEQDIIELARAMTGWVIAVPDRRRVGYGQLDDADPWTSVFIPFRWDSADKTILGKTSNFNMQTGIEHLLDQPRTAAYVAHKLFIDLVGIEPEPNELISLADEFRSDYEIKPLVEAIAHSPAFTSDASVRSKIRSPLEKAAGIINGFESEANETVIRSLEQVSYLPFTAPNPAGYPKDLSLLGPYQYVHVFDLAGIVPEPPDLSTAETFQRLGVHDVSDTSISVVENASDPASRLSLAIASPEYALV